MGTLWVWWWCGIGRRMMILLTMDFGRFQVDEEVMTVVTALM